MYREFFRTKGTGLTVGELKKAFSEEYDEEMTAGTFEGMNEDESAAAAFGGGWLEEKDGYTILNEEVF